MTPSLSFTVFAVLLLTVGCATRAVPPTSANDVPRERVFSSSYLAPQHATASRLTFVRDSGLFGVGVTIHLFLDGEEIAGFRPGERLELFLAPGEYLLGVKSNPNFGLEQFVETPVRVEPSQQYSFRVGIDGSKAIVQRTSAF